MLRGRGSPLRALPRVAQQLLGVERVAGRALAHPLAHGRGHGAAPPQLAGAQRDQPLDGRIRAAARPSARGATVRARRLPRVDRRPRRRRAASASSSGRPRRVPGQRGEERQRRRVAGVRIVDRDEHRRAPARGAHERPDAGRPAPRPAPRPPGRPSAVRRCSAGRAAGRAAAAAPRAARRWSAGPPRRGSSAGGRRERGVQVEQRQDRLAQHAVRRVVRHGRCASGADPEPACARALDELAQEARLADARRPGQDERAAAPRPGGTQGVPQPPQLGAAPHQWPGRCRTHRRAAARRRSRPEPARRHGRLAAADAEAAQRAVDAGVRRSRGRGVGQERGARRGARGQARGDVHDVAEHRVVEPHRAAHEPAEGGSRREPEAGSGVRGHELGCARHGAGGVVLTADGRTEDGQAAQAAGVDVGLQDASPEGADGVRDGRHRGAGSGRDRAGP